MQEYFVSYEIRAEQDSFLMGVALSTFAIQGSAGEGITQAISNLKREAESATGRRVCIHVVVLTKL